MGKSKPKQEVVEYRMSLHYGMCIGQNIDNTDSIHISRIKINDKIAWTGGEDDSNIHEINEPELFGGIKKEGGAVGRFVFFPGWSFQSIHENLANKVGRTEFTMPAYRGQASIWFYEAASNNKGRKGFYWSANQPFIPSVEVLTSRAAFDLGPLDPRLWRPANENMVQQTANPGLIGLPSEGNPWKDWAPFRPIIVSGLSDPFGGQQAFSIEDWRDVVPGGAAMRATQVPTSGENNTTRNQRVICSVYVKRDFTQDIVSLLYINAPFGAGGGTFYMMYDHSTDAVHFFDETTGSFVFETGMLVGPGDWRRLFMDIQSTQMAGGYIIQIFPAYGASADFPDESTGDIGNPAPLGTIEFYGPMIQRIPPTT